MTEAVTNCRAIIKFKENDRQAACAPNPVHAVAFQDVTMNFFFFFCRVAMLMWRS